MHQLRAANRATAQSRATTGKLPAQRAGGRCIITFEAVRRRRIEAIQGRPTGCITDGEDWALVLTEVSRVLKAAADLFWPVTSEDWATSADGKQRKLGDQQYLNRLQEFTRVKLSNSRSLDLLTAELDHLDAFFRQLNDLASKGAFRGHRWRGPSRAGRPLFLPVEPNPASGLGRATDRAKNVATSAGNGVRYSPAENVCRDLAALTAGALGEIRTPGPRNRNPMLYPAELRAHGCHHTGARRKCQSCGGYGIPNFPISFSAVDRSGLPRGPAGAKFCRFAMLNDLLTQ